jgi:hypothetical protein
MWNWPHFIEINFQELFSESYLIVNVNDEDVDGDDKDDEYLLTFHPSIR